MADREKMTKKAAKAYWDNAVKKAAGKKPMPGKKASPSMKKPMPRQAGVEGGRRTMPGKPAAKRSTPQDQRMEALRRKRGRMLGVEGPKVSNKRVTSRPGEMATQDSQRRAQGAKANRQANAEYIRKKPRGDAARLKPRNTPARSYMNSGKKR